MNKGMQLPRSVLLLAVGVVLLDFCHYKVISTIVWELPASTRC